MKKLQLYNTIMLLFCFVMVGNAQFDGVVKHWGFDATSLSKDHFSLFNTSNEITFSSGIEGQSVVLLEKDYYITFGDFLDLEDDFSIVFWFNVLETDGVQSLLLQSKTKENGDVTRYIQLMIDNGKLKIRNEKQYELTMTTPSIQSNFWYQLTYVYNGYDAKIYLDKQLFFQSTETTIYTDLPCCTDKLFIGKPKKSAMSLDGYVDEIMFFDEAIDKNMVDEVNLIMNMKPPEVIIDTPKTFIPQPIERVKRRNKLSKITSRRLNEIQDSIQVSTANIEFEIWDYDEFDKDKVRFILNEEMFYTNILLSKRRKSEKYDIPKTVNLKTNDDNYLIFFAEDMGQFSSQNTAAVRLWLDGKKQDKIYKFILTEDKNAVLKITHSGGEIKEEPIKTDIEPEITNTSTSDDSEFPTTISTNKIATNSHELTVSDTILMLKIRDNSVVDGDSITILHNGKPILTNYGLTSKLLLLPVQLVVNQSNVFTFVPVSMGSRETQNTALVIIEANGKVIDKVTLSSLDKNRPAKLIIEQRMK